MFPPFFAVFRALFGAVTGIYNISVPIFGGFAPFFAEYAIKLTGDRHAPSFYLVLTAVVSLLVLVAVRRRLRLR